MHETRAVYTLVWRTGTDIEISPGVNAWTVSTCVAACISHNGLCQDIYVLDWWVLDKQVIDLCVGRHTNLSVEIINEKTRDLVWRRIQKRLSWPLKTFSLSFYRLRSFILILSIFFSNFHRLFFPSLSRRLRSPLSLPPFSLSVPLDFVPYLVLIFLWFLDKVSEIKRYWFYETDLCKK